MFCQIGGFRDRMPVLSRRLIVATAESKCKTVNADAIPVLV
jgi:hypothetical protein